MRRTRYHRRGGRQPDDGPTLERAAVEPRAQSGPASRRRARPRGHDPRVHGSSGRPSSAATSPPRCRIPAAFAAAARARRSGSSPIRSTGTARRSSPRASARPMACARPSRSPSARASSAHRAGRSTSELLLVADRLLREPEREARWFAITTLERTLPVEPERTWQLLRRAAADADDWITVDTLAHPFGKGILAESYRWAELEQLTVSPSRWERRLVGSTIATMPFVNRRAGREPEVADAVARDPRHAHRRRRAGRPEGTLVGVPVDGPRRPRGDNGRARTRGDPRRRDRRRPPCVGRSGQRLEARAGRCRPPEGAARGRPPPRRARRPPRRPPSSRGASPGCTSAGRCPSRRSHDDGPNAMTDERARPAAMTDNAGDDIRNVRIEDEMKVSYLDYAMSVIVSRALPGRPRRPQARAPPDPVHDGRDGALGHELLPQVRRDRRRGDGQVPPARRRRAVRRARAARPGLLDALPARRRPGQLRLGRRGRGGRDALHGGPPHRGVGRDARRHRQGDGRLRGQLRRHAAPADRPARQAPEPAHQRLVGHRGRDGHEHPAPPPRRDRRRHDRADRGPGDHHGRPVPVRDRPGLPDRRHDLPVRAPAQHHQRRLGDDRRDPPDVRPRPRPRRHARPGRVRGGQGRPDGDHRHRAALPGEQVGAPREDRRARQGQEDRRHRRPARRVGPRRHAHVHRDQARREPAQGAEQPVQAHRAPGLVQHEHARARRRAAPDAAAEVGPPAPRRRTAARSSGGERSSTSRRRAIGRTSSRGSRSPSTTSTR